MNTVKITVKVLLVYHLHVISGVITFLFFSKIDVMCFFLIRCVQAVRTMQKLMGFV